MAAAAASMGGDVPGLPTRGARAGAPAAALERRRGGATVADMVEQHDAVVCGLHWNLAEAAQLLVARDRTSAVVADAGGAMVGALTENDVLNAYSSGVPGHYTVEAWLAGDCARLPLTAAALQTMTVSPATTLSEVAAHFRVQAEGELACRHVIVKDNGGHLRGVLSCLDVVRALGAVDADLAKKVASTPISAVMKGRSMLPTCDEKATLIDAVDKMLAFHQNCVLVEEDGAHGDLAGGKRVLGVITTRDALRAFAAHAPVLTPCERWLTRLHAQVEPRLVQGDVPIAAAATKMAELSLHHLVVVSPETAAVVGVVSSSDLAHAFA